jgi:hypothetical protein
VVVQTRFDFVEAEKEELAKIGSGAEKVTGVQISKMYRGDFHYEFLPTALPHEHDSKQFQSLIDHELSQIPDGISESLRSTFTTVSERAKQMVDRDGVSAFHQKLGELAQIIDQSVRVENPADTPAAEVVKQTLLELNQRASSLPPNAQVQALVQEWVPTFIYMDEHKPFSGIAYLDQIKQRKDQSVLTEEDRTLLMIMEMAGLDFEQEVNRAAEQDKEQRMLDMRDASQVLTNMIARHWSQRKYEVRFEVDGYHLIAFVEDEVQPVPVSLNERSRGFQWFFSFDMTFLHETQGTFKSAVILLDEPGLHLHAAAQRDLLKRMKEYAKGNQLIYTTHMPFMIDMERLDNIRVCTENKEAGTKVTSDFYAADEDARFPLQAALGLSMSQSLFVGQYNLVVEGITDFWLLSTVAALLRADGQPSLDERIVITPSGGASKAAYVGTMLQGQQLSVVVLLDSDPEGQKVAEGLIKQWIMKDRHVLLLGNAIGRSKETTLEDLLTMDFYLQRFSFEREDIPFSVGLDKAVGRSWRDPSYSGLPSFSLHSSANRCKIREPGL